MFDQGRFVRGGSGWHKVSPYGVVCCLSSSIINLSLVAEPTDPS